MGIEGLLLALGLGKRPLVHLPTPGDQIDEDPQKGKNNHEDHPECLRPTTHVLAAKNVSKDHEKNPDPYYEQKDLEHGPEQVSQWICVGKHQCISFMPLLSESQLVSTEFLAPHAQTIQDPD